jgi:hypothetical protein
MVQLAALNRRLNRIKLKRERLKTLKRAQETSFMKIEQRSEVGSEDGFKSTGRGRSDSKPYVRAFINFGATNANSTISSTTFEQGILKLDKDLNHKAILEIFGRYDTTRDGKRNKNE